MFPAGMFQPSASDYAKNRDVRDFAETGEYGEFTGPTRKIARLDDLVGLGGGGGGGGDLTKSLADTYYAPITGSIVYATKAELPDISGKADKTTTYTKTEVDTALSGKQPTGSYLVAADITGKADKSDTYTKTEVNTALTTKSDTTHTHASLYAPLVNAGINNYFGSDMVVVEGNVNLWGNRTVPSVLKANASYAPATGSTVYATKAEVTEATGGGLTQTAADDLYASKPLTYTKTEVDTALAGKQPTGSYLVAADITGKADKSDTYTKSEVDTALAGKQAIGSYLVAADIIDKANTSDVTTALATKADQSTTYTKEEVDTQLGLKVNMAEFNTLVQPYISTWLTVYINTNPNSWVNLRTLLQYYPLTYSTWTVPEHEYVARSTETNLRMWKRITDGSFNVSGIQWNSASTSAYALLTETAVVPYGFRKNSNIYGTSYNVWNNKGSLFLVYSWITTPVAGRVLATSLGNSGTGSINTGARCRWTRSHFAISLEAGGETVFDGLPVVDTEIDTPYIQGLSWDFTVNPPRFCLINQRYVIEHFGPNEPNEMLEMTDTGLIPTFGTSWNIPYTAYHASDTRTANFSLFDFIQTTGTPLRVHYVARWQSTYMNTEQMRTVHMRLLQRYCVPPFPAINYRLQDVVPDPEPEPDP
jgi:hypothetical protein